MLHKTMQRGATHQVTLQVPAATHTRAHTTSVHNPAHNAPRRLPARAQRAGIGALMQKPGPQLHLRAPAGRRALRG
jgi:hypothetical protein